MKGSIDKKEGLRGLSRARLVLELRWTDLMWVLSICLFSGVCLELFYRMIVNFNDRYPSDMRYYAFTLMTNGEPHDRLLSVFFQHLFDINQNTMEINIYLAAAIAAIIVVNYIVLSFYIRNDGLKELPPRWILQFFSLAVLFIGPIYVPVIHEWYYLHSFSSFAWHSPTQQSMTLFSLVACLCFLKLYMDYDKKKIKPGWWLATMVTTLMSATTKPSFLFCLIMAVVVLFIIELIEGGKDEFASRLGKLVIIGTTLIPSGLYIIWLYFNQFVGPNRMQNGEEHKVIFAPLHVFDNNDPIAAMVCGMTFTIVVFIVNYRRFADRKYRFALGVFVMGLAQWVCLTETGRFAKYGNFSWGLTYGTYFMVLVSVAVAIENFFGRDSLFGGNRTRQAIYFAVIGILLVLHICSQIIYFRMILTGHGYMK